MDLDQITFKLAHNKNDYALLTIIVNANNNFEYEFFNCFKNLKILTEFGETLQKEPISKPLFFTISTDYGEVEFKISPLPPMDWLVLSIPVYQGAKKYRFDRLTFCENLKTAILGFMKEMDMDYLGNPKLKVENYDKVWGIIGNDWLNSG